jgi:hypothetical protein
MRVSRRVFLGAAVSAPMLARVGGLQPRCAVVDLGCVLPESLAGFKEQVGDLRYTDGDSDVLIVPAVSALTKAGNELIEGRLEQGATVLLEWIGGARVEQSAYFPYVEYFWPVRVKVREFAPVQLKPGSGDEIIATFSGAPVGLRRRVGNATLITLGSPLGPIFLAGDPDARRWLNEFLKS